MRCKSEKGFTLVEVVMATLLLAIGVAIIGTVISEIVKKNFYSQRHTQAVLLAQNKIEELLNDGYGDPNLDDDTYENPLNPVNATGDSNGVFYQFWEVDDLNPIPGSKLVTSTIQWESTDGELKSVILTTVCIDQSN